MRPRCRAAAPKDRIEAPAEAQSWRPPGPVAAAAGAEPEAALEREAGRWPQDDLELGGPPGEPGEGPGDVPEQRPDVGVPLATGAVAAAEREAPP